MRSILPVLQLVLAVWFGFLTVMFFFVSTPLTFAAMEPLLPGQLVGVRTLWIRHMNVGAKTSVGTVTGK